MHICLSFDPAVPATVISQLGAIDSVRSISFVDSVSLPLQYIRYSYMPYTAWTRITTAEDEQIGLKLVVGALAVV